MAAFSASRLSALSINLRTGANAFWKLPAPRFSAASASWSTLCAPARRYSRRRIASPSSARTPYCCSWQYSSIVSPGETVPMPQTSASTGSGAISMPALARART